MNKIQSHLPKLLWSTFAPFSPRCTEQHPTHFRLHPIKLVHLRQTRGSKMAATKDFSLLLLFLSYFFSFSESSSSIRGVSLTSKYIYTICVKLQSIFARFFGHLEKEKSPLLPAWIYLHWLKNFSMLLNLSRYCKNIMITYRFVCLNFLG